MAISRKEKISENRLRRLYDNYASGVAYISVRNPNGDLNVGSCFHIGDGVYITARHVVEKCEINEVGTTVSLNRLYETEETQKSGGYELENIFHSAKTSVLKGPFFHPDPKIDVAALVIPDLKAPALPLGSHLDDWLGDDFTLSDAIVMGYPPVPFSNGPILITTKCEVNAVIDKYTGGHPQFIISSMARGGFSGGPLISEYDFVLGVVAESLVAGNQPAELGFFSVISVEAIYNCISHHRIVPKEVDEIWDGFWTTDF
jgi:S1-C subfamily serine protease